MKLRWSDFHVAAMVCAAAYDSGIGPFVGEQKAEVEDYPQEPQGISPKNSFELAAYHVIGATPLNDGDYTLKSEHKFIDIMDGEILHLLPGDILSMSRSH